MRLVTRAEWGAEKPRSALTPLGKVNRQVLHHSVDGELTRHSRRGAEEGVIRNIQKGHFKRGFSDIGYHFLIVPSGRIYEGREQRWQGAGVLGANSDTVHVCMVGNFEEDIPTRAAVQACGDAFRMLPGKGMPLYGHGDLGPTACPGANLRTRLPEIRKLREGKP